MDSKAEDIMSKILKGRQQSYEMLPDVSNVLHSCSVFTDFSVQISNLTPTKLTDVSREFAECLQALIFY